MESKFKSQVLKVVSLIPFGKVVSYGQVALYVGVPRAAREVGWILNGIHDENTRIPWWRVVNNSGRISIKGSTFSAPEQKKLLEEEGIEIREDMSFDIENYRFVPNKQFVDSLHLDPVYLEMIASKIPFSKK